MGEPLLAQALRLLEEGPRGAATANVLLSLTLGLVCAAAGFVLTAA